MRDRGHRIFGRFRKKSAYKDRGPLLTIGAAIDRTNERGVTKKERSAAAAAAAVCVFNQIHEWTDGRRPAAGEPVVACPSAVRCSGPCPLLYKECPRSRSLPRPKFGMGAFTLVISKRCFFTRSVNMLLQRIMSLMIQFKIYVLF